MNQQTNSAENEILINNELPSRYENLIDQDEYEELIRMIIRKFEDRSDRLVKIEDGVIYVKCEHPDFVKEAQISLDRLVRHIHSRECSEWESIIDHFFDAAFTNQSAQDFFIEDYEKAKSRLRILIKPEQFFESEMTDQLISKVHFPRTRSGLVLSMEGFSRFVQQHDVDKWRVSVEELFNQALMNTSDLTITRFRNQLTEKLTIYTIGGIDYSAARLIELEKNEPQLMGKAGAIIGIPCNGIVFGGPINSMEEAKELVHALIPVVARAYRLEPSPVLFDLFIYKDGTVVSSMSDFKKSDPALYALMETYFLFKPL